MKYRKLCLPAVAMKHLLAVSVALNVALVLKLMHGGDEGVGWLKVEETLAGPPKRALQEMTSSGVQNNFESGLQELYINLDHGDPTMYESYWKQSGDKTTVVLSGWRSISYFSDTRNLCWFLEPDFGNAVTRLHNLVGNAATENYHIVVGTGSTQLYQAVLYALSPPNTPEPISVVSAAPFYSQYPLTTDCLKSGLHKWEGDANKFDKNGPYIELVTSPNNPDGSIRQAVVNGTGVLVHDLAYYWPQYTPISYRADNDIMLFTVSKCTGHAGTRLGWALVKDEEIAKKMTKFIEIVSIGVSKESQLRAAKILDVISDGYEKKESHQESEPFFEFGYKEIGRRWRQLRAAAGNGKLFSLPDFPTGKCNFSGHEFETQPAFAWMECKGETDDCEGFLREHKILTRGGKHFGSRSKYVRLSMIGREEHFNEFIRRLSVINSLDSPLTKD
nr:tryptophan aminotransferase-related protein 2 [Ipomoea batatas]